MADDRGSSRLPHVIQPDEVDTWLADSVNRQVTYHRTTREAALDILEHGVDIGRSRIGAYGRGFYTATVSGVFPGDAEVAVAVRTRCPLEGDYEEMHVEMEARTRRLVGRAGGLTPEVAAAIRQELLQEGYDGIIVRDGGGDGVDYIIALESASVKVVWP
jgi:hypothetical protein